MLHTKFIVRKRSNAKSFSSSATLYNKISILHCFYWGKHQVLFFNHLKLTYGSNFISKSRLHCLCHWQLLQIFWPTICIQLNISIFVFLLCISNTLLTMFLYSSYIFLIHYWSSQKQHVKFIKLTTHQPKKTNSSDALSTWILTLVPTALRTYHSPIL